MARKKIIAGNWKMNMTPTEAVALVNELKPLVANDEVDAVSYTHLDVYKRQDYNYKIQCGAGSVNIDGDQYSSLGVERKIDNRAARSMELECGVGTIEVQFTGSL